MYSSHLFGAPSRALLFFAALALMLATCLVRADEVVVQTVNGSDFRAAHEALVEAIESEGLVVGAILPFRDMLARTGGESRPIPFAEAEVVQFCSSAIAWEMVTEAPAQLALCPLSIALYTRPGDPAVTYAYRRPGGQTSARREAERLLHRLVAKAAELARLRW